MKHSSLVGHLVEVLEAAHNPSTPVDRTLNRFYRSHRYLGARDRRFISDHLYGLIRQMRFIEFLVCRLRDKGLLPAHMAPANPVLVYLVYAALHRSQTVAEIVEDSADIRNGLLDSSLCETIVHFIRDHDVHRELPEDPVRRDAILYSIPDFLMKEWNDLPGNEGHELAAAMNLEAPVTLRVNSLRTSRAECKELLGRVGIGTADTKISPDGLTASKRLNLTSLNVFRSGLIEPQDEGSQIISYLVNPSAGETIVDACAGAGGKGLHMAALMNNKGRMLAVEPDRRRRKNAEIRARRAGVDILHLYDPEDQDLEMERGLADRVLVDAPCSGSGVFRRNPGAKLFLNPDRVEGHVREQRSILNRYSSFVRPGGWLVYATCSLCRSENEEVVNWFLSVQPAFRFIPVSEVLAKSPLRLDHPEKFLRLYPHRHGTDGFFAAVFRRGDH